MGVVNKIEKAIGSTKPEERQKNEVNEAKLLEILGNLDTQDEPNRSESTPETKPETDSGTESDLESTEKHETQISKEQSKVLETLELTNVCKARVDDLRKQAEEVSKKEEAFKANVEDIQKEMKREHEEIKKKNDEIKEKYNEMSRTALMIITREGKVDIKEEDIKKRLEERV